MFWRIQWRLLRTSRARLAVALLALGSGASVTAALLNLQLDASRKLSSEFRAFGANVIVSAAGESSGASPSTPAQTLLGDAVGSHIPSEYEGQPVAAVPFLYFIAQAEPVAQQLGETNGPAATLVVTGTRLNDLPRVAPGWKIETVPADTSVTSVRCLVGTRAAERLGLSLGRGLHLRMDDRELTCRVEGILTAGGSEDDQVFVSLPEGQQLASLPGRISLVQISVTGGSESIARFVHQLSADLPAAQVRPIRQLTDAEGQLYSRIRGLLLATVILILLLTILCVMTAMTTLAMERMRDVGLMKVLGGKMSHVMRLFLVEAGALGVLGGLLGATLGILLSVSLGRLVFGVAATPRWEVLPFTAGLMIFVAVAGAFPLRLLGRVRPAVIFRGEA